MEDDGIFSLFSLSNSAKEDKKMNEFWSIFDLLVKVKLNGQSPRVNRMVTLVTFCLKLISLSL